MFYAVDIDELTSLFGSNDDVQREILGACAEEIEDNDACFADEIEDGSVPSTGAAISEIVSGTTSNKTAGFMYGYSLKMICEHLGEYVEGGEYGVANVSDHPYQSLLVKSGPPIPIPISDDFPEIGFLRLDQVDEEISRASSPHDKPASESAELMGGLRTLLSSVGLGLRPGGIDEEEIREDIDAYVETLELAKELGRGVVSFRH